MLKQSPNTHHCQWESLDPSLDTAQGQAVPLASASPSTGHAILPSSCPLASTLMLSWEQGVCQPPHSPSSSSGTSWLGSNCSWLWQR